MDTKKVAIIGCGMIGRSWSMIFSGAGYKVVLYDNNSNQLEAGLHDIRSQLQKLSDRGELRSKRSVDQHMQLIKTETDLEPCVKSAFYIQECVYEDVDLKRLVHTKIDGMMDHKAILASSTSCILPARIADTLMHRNRFIVVHPTNPPYYVPVVECLPSERADEDVLVKTRELMKDTGQVPITVKKQKDGMILCRLQNAISKECFDLFRRGIMSASEIDEVFTEGLGRGYAFMGVLETAYLNVQTGFHDFGKKYGKVVVDVQNTFLPPQSFNDVPVLEKIQEEMTKKTQLDKIQERYQWRDERLSALNKLIRHMDNAK